MPKIMVAGSGTDVGKTIVSAILTTLFDGDYWKPIQCGEERDSEKVKALIDTTRHTIHPPAYSLKNPLSPHHAARLEEITIQSDTISPPKANRPLIIEGVGGVFVPLTTQLLTFDLFTRWDCQWIVVSNHYLGSINHTLLTLDALKRRGVSLMGLIFNGEPNPDSEAAILEISQVPFLGRLLPEKQLNPQTIQRYAERWRPQMFPLIS